MAIGNFNNGSSNSSYQNNSSGNRVYDPTYYSRLRLRGNGDENKSLTIQYRSGLMIVEINIIDVSNGYKPTPISTIYISGMKANILAIVIDEFKAYKKTGNTTPGKAFGITTGSGDKISYIGFSTSDGEDTIITIGKFDDNGKIMESNTMTLAKEYNYSVEWENIESNDLVKVWRDEMDLDVFQRAVSDFGRSYSGALGYGTLDLNRYEQARDRRSMDQVFDRLGIERRSANSGNYNGGSNNFLNNASSSKSTTIDEVTNLLDD